MDSEIPVQIGAKPTPPASSRARRTVAALIVLVGLGSGAMRLTADDADAHYKLGEALANKKDWDGAIREYREAIRLKPDYPEAHVGLGWALDSKKDSEGAIREFREAIRLNPDYAQAHVGLGWELENKTNWDGAIAEYREAIRLNPDYLPGHAHLEWALENKKDWDGAIRELGEVIRLEPDRADAHNNLGWALANKNDWDGAIRELREAIRLNPDYAQAHLNLGEVLKKKNDWDGAIQEDRVAVRLKPDEPYPHNSLGEALEQRGDLLAAFEEYSKAHELDPKNSDYRNHHEGLRKKVLRRTAMQALIFLFVVLFLFVLGTVLSGLFTVPTAKAGVVQRFGKFVRVAGPGLNFKWPWIEKVVAKVDLHVRQLDVKMETKTKDNVFVQIPVSVQYLVLPDRIFEAYYKLSDPKEQIGSYVFNVILGHVPKMNLDEAFERQNDIAVAVKQELDGVMADFGYGIVKALVTDIIPDPKVKAAMNDINAARREQEAANARGEAEKILKVKQAEAEAQSKLLQGQGIANQRKAIIDGLRESVETFKAGVEGTSAKDVMMLVLLTQYFDTLKEIGASAHSNTIMMPHSPGGMVDFFEQIRNAVVLGGAVTVANPVASGPG